MIEFEGPWRFEMESEDDFIEETDFESLLRNAHPYAIFPDDLDKRCRAMLEILVNPKSNKRYSINAAIALSNKFRVANRQDLAEIIQEALI
jgi:hypothetical protein